MRTELRRALWEAVLAVRDGKGWPLRDRVPEKPRPMITTTEPSANAITVTRRAGKERMRLLREYAAQNPHVKATVDAEIARIKRGE